MQYRYLIGILCGVGLLLLTGCVVLSSVVEPSAATPELVNLDSFQENAQATPEPGGATVTLYIFSGRRDPTWLLTPEQTAELDALLSALPIEDDPGVDIYASTLGYRGLGVEITGANPRHLDIAGGYIALQPEGRAQSWWLDQDRTVERWLLDTGYATPSTELQELIGPLYDSLSETPVPASAEPVDAGDPVPHAQEGFALYLLSGNLPVADVITTELDALELQEPPIITQDDIVAYNLATHEMTLTEKALERLPGMQIPVSGIPFVVAVNGERIYMGGFWTYFSSLSFDGLVIMPPLPVESSTIRVQLCYPESPELFTGEDLRGDQRIVDALKDAGKLR